MHLPLMKALWHGETSLCKKGANLFARIFESILAMLCMRLMGLKLEGDSCPSFFGIRTIFAVFRRCQEDALNSMHYGANCLLQNEHVDQIVTLLHATFFFYACFIEAC
jgi:hypothetical protein